MTEAPVETRLISTFKKGLEEAVAESGSLSWESDVDSIQEQKLLLMAIREMGLEDQVTIEWYADGDMLPKLDEADNPSVLAIASDDGEDGTYPTVSQVKQYFLEEADPSLESILGQDTFEWLKDYYAEHDTPFEELYLANMQIHLHNLQCAKVCNPAEEEQEFPDEFVEPISAGVRKMKAELVRYPLFYNLPPYVTEYGRVAERVMEWCEEIDIDNQDDVTEYETLFNHLNRFYYQAVWKLITARIAVYTIEGPNDHWERLDIWNNLDRGRDVFISEFNKFKETANEFDISVDIRRDRLPDAYVEEWELQDVLEWDESESLSSEKIRSPSDEDPVANLVN